MKPINTLLIALGVLVNFGLKGQTLQVVAGSGGYSAGVNGSISWTLGEVVIATATNGVNTITQGFQQGNVYVTGIEQLNEIEIAVYPNPASDFITISSPSDITLTIYDNSGRLISSQSLYGTINEIDVTEFARGTYILVFESADQFRRSAQLVVM